MGREGRGGQPCQGTGAAVASWPKCHFCSPSPTSRGTALEGLNEGPCGAVGSLGTPASRCCQADRREQMCSGLGSGPGGEGPGPEDGAEEASRHTGLARPAAPARASGTSDGNAEHG